MIAFLISSSIPLNMLSSPVPDILECESNTLSNKVDPLRGKPTININFLEELPTPSGQNPE